MVSSSVRIRRGFSRIGIALATVFAVLAGVWGAVVFFQSWSSIDWAHEQAQCIVRWETSLSQLDSPRRPQTPSDPVATRQSPSDRAIQFKLVPVLARDIGCPGTMYEVDTKQAMRLVSTGTGPQRNE